MRNRPEPAKAIDALPTKGVLVLAEWDRASRSLIFGIHTMERVHKRGAFKVLDRPGLDLTTPSGRGILALLSGQAEEERTRILKRANEGRRHQARHQARVQIQARRPSAAGSHRTAQGRRKPPDHRQELAGSPCNHRPAGGLASGPEGLWQ